MESKVLIDFIKTSNLKRLADLVDWLQKNLRKNEFLDFECWTGSHWYIIVENQAWREYTKSLYSIPNCPIRPEPANSARFGFTVDISADRILWNNSPYAICGGNCFCRDARWWRLFKEKFPKQAKGLTGLATEANPFIHRWTIVPSHPSAFVPALASAGRLWAS